MIQFLDTEWRNDVRKWTVKKSYAKNYKAIWNHFSCYIKHVFRFHCNQWLELISSNSVVLAKNAKSSTKRNCFITSCQNIIPQPSIKHHFINGNLYMWSMLTIFNKCCQHIHILNPIRYSCLWKFSLHNDRPRKSAKSTPLYPECQEERRGKGASPLTRWLVHSQKSPV